MMLDNLISQKEVMQKHFCENAPGPDEIWAYQELLYRIHVLETLKMLCQTAPCCTDVQMIIPHYHMVDAYIRHLSLERQFGKPRDDAHQKQRQTALASLNTIIGDYRRRFKSFKPASAELYGTEITKVICTVIAAWITHRNCYINLAIEEATAA